VYPTFAGRSVQAIEGRFTPFFIPPPEPGNDWGLTFEGGWVVRPILIHANLVASAQVAERQPRLQLLDNDGHAAFSSPCFRKVAAGEKGEYSAAAGQVGSAGAAGSTVTFTLPEVFMPAGWSIGVITTNLQTEDQWSLIRLWVDMLHDTDPARAAGTRHHPRLELDLEVASHGT